MSRLKFRAWHEIGRVMQDFELSDIITNRFGKSSIPWGMLHLPLDELKIMRYLGEGCIYESGQEMCEDDICLVYEEKCIITYRNGQFCFSVINRAVHYPVSDHHLDAEFLGNKHQNPEILK